MSQRRGIALLVVAASLLSGLLFLRWLLDPAYLVPKVLAMAGNALGLEITASGTGDYRLRGTPQLTARNLVVREPGSAAILLRAARLQVSLPWSTLRFRGAELSIHRVDLDAPSLDVAALQRWLAKRPPGPTRIPALTRGVGITGGRVAGEGWGIDKLDIDVPALAANAPLRAHVRGQARTGTTRFPLDVHATLTSPASGAGLGVVGILAIENPDWKFPSDFQLSAKLRTKQGLRLQNAVLASRSRLSYGSNEFPVVLGIATTLRIDGDAVHLAPLGLATIGAGAMPTLTSGGDFSADGALRFALTGELASWPNSWPALPLPAGSAASPLPFRISYQGPADLSGLVTLDIRYDRTEFEGRFRLPQVMDWIDAGATGSPVPPLRGTVRTPLLEVSGATLEGVEIDVDDADVPDAPVMEGP
ncbi:MAG: hypothetical protein EON92_03365 [Burkholderiales bacterium]|nr:MAG: hypothetical protein EON92_03365 [Burkholderiales bacterium]